jgi:archaellum component FlaC
MKDLTERLRSTQNPGLAVRQQAADALERLTAENTALRKDAEQRNKAIQRLMARLADLLQDDDFNTLERWVLEAGFTYPPIDAAMEQSHECR